MYLEIHYLQRKKKANNREKIEENNIQTPRDRKRSLQNMNTTHCGKVYKIHLFVETTIPTLTYPLSYFTKKNLVTACPRSLVNFYIAMKIQNLMGKEIISDKV